MTDSGHYLRPSSGSRPTTTERTVSWGLRPPRGSAALRHEPPLHRLRRIVLRTTRENAGTIPHSRSRSRSVFVLFRGLRRARNLAGSTFSGDVPKDDAEGKLLLCVRGARCARAR
jgi:hypothetical protein